MTVTSINAQQRQASGAKDQKRGEKPTYRTFRAEVSRVQRLSPSFVRITFTGPGIAAFGAAGLDQRIKVMLPQPGCDVRDFPDGANWYTDWLATPEQTRPVLRTYTVRAFRPELERPELDIDFVLHGDHEHAGGPASTWAARAQPGDEIGLLGPDRPGTGPAWGCAWAPATPTGPLLLAGDETAVPAVAAILESLPSHATGVACLEVPHEEDRQEWDVPSGVDVRWFARDTTPGQIGALLEDGVRTAVHDLYARDTESAQDAEANTELPDVNVDTSALWEAPETGDERFYGWLAGEAAVIKRLRRTLVHDFGVPKSAVAFMGYWRAGRC